MKTIFKLNATTSLTLLMNVLLEYTCSQELKGCRIYIGKITSSLFLKFFNLNVISVMNKKSTRGKNYLYICFVKINLEKSIQNGLIFILLEHFSKKLAELHFYCRFL